MFTIVQRTRPPEKSYLTCARACMTTPPDAASAVLSGKAQAQPPRTYFGRPILSCVSACSAFFFAA